MASPIAQQAASVGLPEPNVNSSAQSRPLSSRQIRQAEQKLMATSANMNSRTPREPLSPPGVFSDPMIILSALDHRQSVIILHGRGSTADEFAPDILATKASDSEKTLQETFPRARIIFPTASRNRATIYKRSSPHQWFDNWHLDDHTCRQDLIAPMLKKSVAYIHGLLKYEIEAVGAENVVLWGLSQGCATTLSALLTWEGADIAGVVGMCGYLPWGNVVRDIATATSEDDMFAKTDGEDDDDPFAHSGDEDEDEERDTAADALSFFREEIEMDVEGTRFRQIPVFLGHGMEDTQVPTELGREARSCLDLLGVDVEMKWYPRLGHWYSEDMFRDIFRFLTDKLKVKDE